MIYTPDRKIWQERTGIERLKKHSTVCEAHFDIGDVTGSGGRKHVRTGAVPRLCREPGGGQGRDDAGNTPSLEAKLL